MSKSPELLPSLYFTPGSQRNDDFVQCRRNRPVRATEEMPCYNACATNRFAAYPILMAEPKSTIVPHPGHLISSFNARFCSQNSFIHDLHGPSRHKRVTICLLDHFSSRAFRESHFLKRERRLLST